MRVLHVFKVYLPDSFTGIERVIWEIAEATAPLGVENRVFSLTRRDDLAPVAIGHHWSHAARQDFYLASTGFSASAFAAFGKLAREADLINYHFPWPFMDLLHFVGSQGKPAVVTYHSDIVRQRVLNLAYRPLMLGFLKSMNRIVATSPNYAQSSPVLQRFKEKTTIIPIGIRDEPAPDVALVEKWRERAGESFFLFVGALRYYKGLQFLAQAARDTGLAVVVAGTGEMERELRDIPNLKMVGRVSDADKAALLSLCTAFVFPSHLRSEAFGVALLEAARAGKPMISCEVGSGTNYINRHGETGLVVPPADADALGRAMREILADARRLAEMGRRARKRYEDLFKAEAMGQAYHRLYQGVVGQRGP